MGEVLDVALVDVNCKSKGRIPEDVEYIEKEPDLVGSTVDAAEVTENHFKEK